MKEQQNKSVSLLELLISITLLSVIILSLTSIDLFSRHHLISSDRRTRLQNQLYFVMEHMSKEIPKAIGNENIYGADTVVNQQVLSEDEEHARLRVYIDANGDGIRQDPKDDPTTAEDHWIAYYFYHHGAPSNKDSIRYCARCSKANNPCTAGGPVDSCMDPGWVTLNSNIRYFIPTKPITEGVLSANYVDVEIMGCFDPTEDPDSCGSANNPIVTLRTNIKMPSVSVP